MFLVMALSGKLRLGDGFFFFHMPSTSQGCCWKNRNVVSDNGTCGENTTLASLLIVNFYREYSRRCFSHLRTVLDVLSEAQCLLDLRRVRKSTVFCENQDGISFECGFLFPKWLSTAYRGMSGVRIGTNCQTSGECDG